MVQVETVNLAEMEDVRRFAYKILETETPVDILVCNGDLTMERMYRTEAGLEVMMATNHLSFFLLVNILLPSIARSKGRIVVGTSALSSNLNSEKNFVKSQAITNIQLAN